jgi:hypothetical protein
VELYIYSPYISSWRGHGHGPLKYLPVLGRNVLPLTGSQKPCVCPSVSGESSLQPYIVFDCKFIFIA